MILARRSRSCASRLLPLVSALFVCAGASAQQPARIAANGIAADIDACGLIVGFPRGALRSVDGPRVVIDTGDAELVSVSYTTPARVVEAAATSRGVDWATRTPLRRAGFRAGNDRAHSVLRTDELELTSDYQFDVPGQYLVCTIGLRNVSDVTLGNVFLSREWLTSASGWTFPDDLPAHAGAPLNLCRRLWMADNLEPGETSAFTFSWCLDSRPSTLGGTNVPLIAWDPPGPATFLDFGATNGISFGDYDGDGYPDLYCAQSRRVWQNNGGNAWVLIAELPIPIGSRYGSAFGDYDRDGRNDIATTPRGVATNLLHNLGNGSFVDVAGNPAILPNRATGAGETVCWGDTDSDGRLDLFIPTYPPSLGSPGNFFYWNRGPVGPGGEHAFLEQSAVGGLDNPAGAARPEGAQFCDYDFDGDLDLYCNNTIYQNRSTPGTVDYDNLPPATSGITLFSNLEEGAVFCDFDLDGDFDMPIVYSASPGLRIWENRGDGTFRIADSTIIDSPLTGLDLGLSAEDWDNDGDIDLTTRQVFRINQLAETGVQRFIVGTHAINAAWLTSATPAWGDWDKDGDLDCALGNWQSTGHFMVNTTYDASTLASERRYVRVLPMQDGPEPATGYETEYGATVELRVQPATDAFHRIKFTSSSNGYLNQNEYGLTFALPPDPVPGDDAQDLSFELVVTFPSAQGRGLRRVDKFSTPILASIPLATLVNREIRVFRSGLVVMDGVCYFAGSELSLNLSTTTGGLRLPSQTTPQVPLVPAPVDTWAGIEIDMTHAQRPQRTRELILDGQLAAPVADAGGDFNVALWDVTDALQPVLLARHALATRSRNDRSFLPYEVALPPGRLLRLVARLSSTRGTSIVAPVLNPPLRVDGGLRYVDSSPVDGAGVSGASLDAAQVFLAVRFGI